MTTARRPARISSRSISRAFAVVVSLGLAATGLTMGASSVSAAVGDISVFNVGANGAPRDAVTGPDGNLWVTNSGTNSIVKMSMTGEVLATYPVPTANAGIRDITVGPDSNLWFTMTAANKIGRMTTSGAVVEFSVPTADAQPWSITTGPDGALWFTQFAGNRIGRITTAGQVTNEYAVPTAGAGLWGITSGPEGSSRLYFTESAKGKAGFITVTGQISEIALPASNAEPRGIAVVNGSVWFAMHGSNAMGNLLNDTTVASVALPQAPSEMVVGPADSMWVTTGSNSILNLNSSAVVQGTYALPVANAQPTGLTLGRDGNVWVALTAANAVARVITGQILTNVVAPVLSPSSAVVPGTVITTSNGEWTFQAGSYAYQWQRCSSDQVTSCAAIPGATVAAYTVTTTDTGQRLRSVVTATNAAGSSAPAYSTLLAINSGTPTPLPVPAPLPAGVVSVGAGATMEIDAPFGHKRGKRKTYDVDFSSTAVTGTVTVTFAKPRTSRVKVFAGVPVVNGVATVSWKVPRKWPLKKTVVTATFTPAAGSVYTAATAADRVKITR